MHERDLREAGHGCADGGEDEHVAGVDRIGKCARDHGDDSDDGETDDRRDRRAHLGGHATRQAPAHRHGEQAEERTRERTEEQSIHRRESIGADRRMSVALGGLESPALCQSGAVRVLVLAAARPTDRPPATPCPLKEPSGLGGFAGADPGSRKGSNRIIEPGSTPARFEPPDHSRSS